MSTIKKNQHYVWRKYLKSWTLDEGIWTINKEQRHIFKSNLTGVAQERYFYRLQDIDQIGLQFLKEFINVSDSSVREFQRDILTTFTLPMAIKKQLGTNGHEELQERLRAIEINTMENAHGYFENLGTELTSFTTFDDLQKLEDPDIRGNSAIFISFQYLRTRKMRESIARSFGHSQMMPGVSVWNILVFLMALNVAKTIAVSPNRSFTLLENRTNVPFLTGDQPVINLKGQDRDVNGQVTALELYYPLSPSLALIIALDGSTTRRYHITQPDSERVNWLNGKLLSNSERFVFAKTRDQLVSLI